MRSGLPYAGRAVHALQSEREAERAHGDPSLCRPGQTADARDMSRGLSAEELAVQRLDSGDYHILQNNTNQIYCVYTVKTFNYSDT